MEVLLAPSAGFCLGVRRAVERAVSVAAESTDPVYTDGPLIHNPGMLASLEKLGVHMASDPAAVPAGSVLLIRAHGIPPERRRFLDGLPLRLCDATCPEVARIQGFIRARVARGRSILILGDDGHAEVVGLLGHAQGFGRVISGPADVAALPDDLGPVTLVSQTTQDVSLFRKVADAVLERFPDAEILDTICAATKSRQSELADLAEKADAIVVVGSSTSANSVRLAEIAGRSRPSILVRGPEDIKPERFAGMRCVGLTAGASTPDDTIAAVRDRLRSLPPATEANLP